MAKRKRVGPHWRSLIALVLVGFVLVTTGVIARRVYGVRQAVRIRDLSRQLDALGAERVRLDGAIRAASSRSRLVPLAEQRLNMHIASPDQQILLTRPARSDSSVHDSL